MTGVFVLTCITAYLAGYFTVGWRLARRDLPNAWRRARREWASESSIRDSVRWQTICTTLWWPLILPTRAVRDQLDQVAAAGDPEALKQELERPGPGGSRAGPAHCRA